MTRLHRLAERAIGVTVGALIVAWRSYCWLVGPKPLNRIGSRIADRVWRAVVYSKPERRDDG